MPPFITPEHEIRSQPSSGSPTWRPLLQGGAARRAWKIVEGVAAALDRPPANDPTLAFGSAGQALFLAQLARISGDDRAAESALAFLRDMIEAVPRTASRPGLFSGFTGPAFVLEHLEGRFLEPSDDQESRREIDDDLLERLARRSWEGEYDLISGLAGEGVYALEALSRPAGREALARIVVHFERLVERRSPGVAWRTPAERIPEPKRQSYPRGYFDLGLAHGTPAIVVLLAGAEAAGIEGSRARRLVEDAFGWLLAQELPDEAESCFPYAAGETRPARLAWCYGDAGIATALLATARLVERTDWEAQALRIARRAAARTRESSGVVDASLCHGAAGLGHLFNRLFQATGDEKIGAAAVSWLEQTIEMRQPKTSTTGFRSWWEPTREWREDRGFLNGAAGIALALLAAVTDVEPEWDRALLASIPPRRQRL